MENILNGEIFHLSELATIRAEVNELVNDNINIEIKSLEDYTQTTDLLKIVNERIKRLEEKRKEWTKPILDAKKSIDDDFKMVISPLEGFVALAKSKMIVWKNEEQKRLDEEQDKIEEQAREKAKADGVKDPEIIVPVVNDIKTQRGEVGVATSVKRWVFEIEDPSQVPHEYCSPDEKKIKLSVDNGFRKIPGVKIYEKEDLRIR